MKFDLGKKTQSCPLKLPIQGRSREESIGPQCWSDGWVITRGRPAQWRSVNWHEGEPTWSWVRIPLRPNFRSFVKKRKCPMVLDSLSTLCNFYLLYVRERQSWQRWGPVFGRRGCRGEAGRKWGSRLKVVELVERGETATAVLP